MNKSVNPLTIPLYAGLANVEMPVERIDFGEGVVLRRASAEISAPYIVGFKNESRVDPYWRTITGFGFNLSAELFIPIEFEPKKFFDRLNTIWWLAALIRAVGNPLLMVPMIASHSFAEMADPNLLEEPSIWPMELDTRRLLVEKQTTHLSVASLDWVIKHWRDGGSLMHASGDFNVAFQAFDRAIASPSPSLALVTLWGALERLFSPSHQELTFRVSSSIATYLEPAGPRGLAYTSS